MAIGVILARTLGPQEFGTFAVAFVALIAVLSFNELGVSLAIVRWKEDPSEIAPTVNAISLGMSAVLSATMVAGAPLFADMMGDPGATNLVRLLSLCVLVNGLVATPAAVMQRLFRQDQRMVADQVNVWVGAFVSLGCALAGLGAMSLVVGRLSGALLSAVLLLRFSPLPYRVSLDRRHLRPLLAFGLPLAGSSLILFVAGFVDQLLVGHVLGPVQLGFYVLAANLAGWPVVLFSQPLRSVAPAMFSRLQHEPAGMRSLFLQVQRPLFAVALPVCLTIAACSDEVIRFVYGAAWAPAGQVLRWLALLAVLRIFFELSYDFLVVLGRSRTILLIQLVWIAGLVPALWFGVHRAGIEGAAAAMVVVSALLSAPMYLVGLGRAGVPVGKVLRGLLLPSLGAVLVAAAATGLVGSLTRPFPALLASGGLTLMVCTGLLRVFRSDLAVFRGRGTDEGTRLPAQHGARG